MVNTRTIHECNFSEIFYFAEEKYGIDWNTANDLFFRTEVLRWGSIHEVHPKEMPSYIMYMGENKLTKSCEVPADEFAKMNAMEKAKLIILAFGEANGVEHSLMVDAT